MYGCVHKTSQKHATVITVACFCDVLTEVVPFGKSGHKLSLHYLVILVLTLWGHYYC